MVFRIKRHTVIAVATSDGILCDHRIGCWVEDRKEIVILQVEVDLASHWVVLRHTGLTVEVKRLENDIRVRIDNGLGLASLVGDVEFVERRGVGTPIGLVVRRELFDNLHARQTCDADGVVPAIGGVHHAGLRNEFDAFHAWRVCDGTDNLVRPEVDYVDLTC